MNVIIIHSNDQVKIVSASLEFPLHLMPHVQFMGKLHWL